MRKGLRGIAAGLSLALVAGGLGIASAATAFAATSLAAPSVARPAQTITIANLSSLIKLAPESDNPPYNRDYFVHWIDADGNGCDTREEVLIAESRVKAVNGAGCKIISGKWYSPYDNVTVTNPSSLDIDHFVPLHEAWQSGASAWTPAQRQAYANDLGWSGALIAVSAASNRSKSDSDPAGWLPTYRAFDCAYVENWILDKYRWSLSTDALEKAAIESQLAKCPPAVLTLPPVVAGIPTIGGTTASPEPTPTDALTSNSRATPIPAPSAKTSSSAAALPLVTPGAYCASNLIGKSGKSSVGVVYTCKTSPTDARLRWRR